MLSEKILKLTGGWGTGGGCYPMCDVCIKILGKNATKHAPNSCILAKTLYCNLCCVYGHSPSTCPRKALKALRESAGILQETALDINIPEDAKNWVEIIDCEKSFSAALIANKIVPMACQEKGRLEERDYHENKERLVNFLKGMGKKLVLIALPWTSVEDAKLLELHTQFPNDWKLIAVQMVRRTQEHCKIRFKKLSSR